MVTTGTTALVCTPRFDGGELCAACGGNCCRHGSGCFLPGDVPGIITLESMRAFLDDRDAVLHYSGDGLVVRPRMDYQGFMQGAICVHLLASGCALGSQRPTMCQTLEPCRPGVCKQHIGGEDNDHVFAATAWKPFIEILHELCDDYEWRASLW